MKHQVFTIPIPKLFSFAECLWFLDRNLDDCMHEVKDGYVRKLLDIKGKPVLIRISEIQKVLQVEVLYGTVANTEAIISYIKEWFDLERDIRPFYALLKKDKDLSVLAEHYKRLHMVGIPNFFEALCWSIIGQQINLQFAYRVKRRLVEQYGQCVTYENKKYYLFPEPEIISTLRVDELRSFQLTQKKAEYILTIAKRLTEGALSKQQIHNLPTEDEMIASLVNIRGIGPWTANYTLMKSLRIMNCVPYGDAGIHHAVQKLKGIDKNNQAAIKALFDAFEGWKTYLVYYLWRSLREPE
ncbi:MAG: DNA repair protein [Bacteroidota bacterium]